MVTERPPKPTSTAGKDFEVLVTWDQLVGGAWCFYVPKKRRYFATQAHTDDAYIEQLNNNGFLDPGREDIRDVIIQKLYRGKAIDTSDAPCSPERNQYWLGEVRRTIAACTGPLVNALKASV